MSEIKKAYVHFNNDPSVGMFAYGFELELSFNFDPQDDDDKKQLEEIRAAIKNLYELTEGEEPSWVMFDVELEAEHQAELEMNKQNVEYEAWLSEHMDEFNKAGLPDNLDDAHRDYIKEHNERVLKNRH